MSKFDYEPILSAGRHEMTIEQFERRFVIGLGGVARTEIWRHVKDDVLEPITNFDIKCELWIDGSFITKCPRPDDIDGSLMILSDVVQGLGDDAFSYLDRFDDYRPTLHRSVDFYLCQIYPRGHELRGDFNDPDGWAEQWSKEHNSAWLKGFVVIPFR